MHETRIAPISLRALEITNDSSQEISEVQLHGNVLQLAANIIFSNSKLSLVLDCAIDLSSFSNHFSVSSLWTINQISHRNLCFESELNAFFIFMLVKSKLPSFNKSLLRRFFPFFHNHRRSSFHHQNHQTTAAKKSWTLIYYESLKNNILHFISFATLDYVGGSRRIASRKFMCCV